MAGTFDGRLTGGSGGLLPPGLSPIDTLEAGSVQDSKTVASSLELKSQLIKTLLTKRTKL